MNDIGQRSFSVSEINDFEPARSFVNIIASLAPIVLLLSLNEPGSSVFAWLAVAFAAGIAFFSIRRYPEKMAKHPALIFFWLSVPIFAASCVSTAERIHKPNEVFFFAYKVLALLIAVLAPSPQWIGYVLLSLCLFIPPLQVLLVTPEIGNATREPWPTIEITTAAIFILRHQLMTRAKIAATIEMKAQEKSRIDFSEAAGALRDLTNTPLQSLDLLAEMLNAGEVAGPEASAHLRAANYRLNEVMLLLNERASDASRNVGSPDSFEILRKKMSRSNQIGQK
jgi:hypothetical protein